MKQILFAILLISSSFQLKAGDTTFNGVDLNPALIGCILTGGNCLDIPFLNRIFGKEPVETDDTICFIYFQNWCDTHYNSRLSGYQECRALKQRMYKKAKQSSGQWPSDREFEKRYPLATWRPKSVEQTYFDDIERELTKEGKAPFFTCTATQQKIWLKSKCGHTRWANMGTYELNKDWSNREIKICK